jgi:hypothetical protein
MRKIIDFHTHAFPDSLAEKAMAQLHSELHGELYGQGDFIACLDGKLVHSLLRWTRPGLKQVFYAVLRLAHRSLNKF